MTVHTWIQRSATLVAAGGLVLVSGLFTGPASAQTAAVADDTTTCRGVLSGGGEGELTKTLVSIVAGAQAGTYEVEYRLDSGRAPGSYRVRDCSFIDTGAPGYNGEPLVGGADEKDTLFTPTGSGSTANFTVTVTGVQPDDLLCDRAAVSGVEGLDDFTDKSNLLCITPNSPPVIPEAPFALMLPLVAAGAIGVVLFVRRRQNPGSSALAA